METAQTFLNIFFLFDAILVAYSLRQLRNDVKFWKTATLNLQVKLATKEQLDKLINALSEEPPTHSTQDETSQP